uniref:Gustatory receptor n=1 Tax=Anopheles culicifacies TaxID=139723 RepID=A0A182MQJ8_9DIPT
MGHQCIMGQSVSRWFQAEPYHVFDVMKYSEVLCSAVGVNFYQYVGNPANIIAKLSVARVVNFIMLNLMLVIVAAIHGNIPYEVMNNGSMIVMYGIRALLVGGVLGTSIGIVLIALKWKSTILLLQNIYQLDLKQRFDTSNKERDGRWLDGTVYRDGTVQERIRVLLKLSELHHQLNEIAVQMCEVYGDVFLVNLLVIMTFAAFNIFTLLRVYTSNDPRTIMFAIFNFCGSSFYTMMLMLFISLSRKVSKESKLTGVLIHKAMNNETNGELIQSMVVFSRQIRNRSAVIGSRNVTFDWPFVFEQHVLSKRTPDQVLFVLAILMDVYALVISAKTAFISSDSILLNVGINSSVYLGIMITLAISICNRVAGRRMFRIFETINHVDNMLMSYGYRPNHQLNHILGWIYIGTPILTNGIFFFVGDQSSVNFTALEILTFLRSSGEFPTSLTADPQKAATKEVTDAVATVRFFGDLHEKLSEAIIDFNYCFALQILLMIASAFVPSLGPSLPHLLVGRLASEMDLGRLLVAAPLLIEVITHKQIKRHCGVAKDV